MGNYRTQRRCKNQLSTAAPRDSPTLHWTPRSNTLAKCTLPRTSYSSRRSCVLEARRRTRKLDRSWIIQKSHQISPTSRTRADLPKPPQLVVALVPKVGFVRMHRGAVSAKPVCLRNLAVAGRQDTLVVTPRKFSLCSTNSHPAVQTVGLAMLIRNADPVAKISWRESWRSISRSQDGLSRPVQCVSYITAMTPPRNRSDRCPVMFCTWSICRNVVLSDVARGGFLEKY